MSDARQKLTTDSDKCRVEGCPETDNLTTVHVSARSPDELMAAWGETYEADLTLCQKHYRQVALGDLTAFSIGETDAND